MSRAKTSDEVVRAPPSLEELISLFQRHGGTQEPYLRDHFPRFLATRKRFLERWQCARGNRLLDVGAHWLHQALMCALDGFQVTALDLPVTLELPEVKSVAQEYSIRLAPNPDLEHPTALARVADDTFDIVLITEVIEHLAFNPVAMWRELYRVMKPGARLVLTTPNYYALRARIRRLLRSAHRLGAGVEVDQILSMRTLGHHWKEYSARELLRYFAMLSPDFVVGRIAYTEEYQSRFLDRWGARFVEGIERAMPPLRPDLYLEIDLPRKEKGILPQPRW